MKRLGFLTLAAYVATIFAANWALKRYGIVKLPLGLSAPAGVFAAGLAFVLRDIVQDQLGRVWAIVGILLGAAFSALVSPTFALASAVAFLVSEVLDMTVYSHLRDRQWDAAVIASGIVGAVIDSLIFLQLAFGSTQFWQGQVVVKIVVVAVAWLLWKPVRRRVVA